MLRAAQVLKRLEARIALALSRADRGFAAAAAGRNNDFEVNTGIIPASGTPTLSAVAFTSQTGRVRIDGAMSISAQGGSLAALDQLVMGILRGGSLVPGAGQEITTVEASAAGTYFVSGFVIDTPPVGTPVIYSVRVSVGGGHTAGVNTGQAQILIQDLPL